MKHCRWKTWLSTIGMASVLGIFGCAGLAHATVPSDLLELDGNTAFDGSGAYDWDSVTNQLNPYFDQLDPIGGLQFTQGSKDTQDVSHWVIKSVDQTTPKDDLQEVWGGATHDNGDTILYFAARRLDASGTTTYGFWLFGATVICDTSSGVDPNCFADDEHKEDDTLIVVDVGGNTIEGVRIYKWQGGDGTDGSLVQTAAVGTANCSSFTESGGEYLGTDICGAVSADGLFFEIGLNYGQLFGDTCVSSVMATTRTSNRANASTKNFTLDGFKLCGADVTKYCETTEIVSISPPSFTVDVDPVVITNTGVGSFDSTSTVDLVDDAGTSGDTGDDIMVSSIAISGLDSVCEDGSGDIAEPVTTCIADATCTAVDATWSCAGNGGTDGFQPGERLAISNAALTFTSSTNGPTNGIKATVNDPASGTSVDSTETLVSCDTIDISPMLYADKTCATTLQVTNQGQVSVLLDYDGTFCNTGSLPLVIDVHDDTANQDLVINETLDNGQLCLETADCTSGLGGECFGQKPGTCSGGSNNGASCTVNSDCNSDVCEGAIAGVCVDASTGLLAPNTGTCSGGSNDGASCTVDGDCNSDVCEGTLQVCDTYSGSFLPAQAGGPDDKDGTCLGGDAPHDACAVDADCSGGNVCLVPPGTASFFNQVTVEANTGDNPLLPSAQTELPTATCPLCPD